MAKTPISEAERQRQEAYRKLGIDNALDFCEKNNNLEALDWIITKLNTPIDVKVYPKKEVNGVMVEDKSQEPTIEKKLPNWSSLKSDFCKLYMPELLKKENPPKPKKPTMLERAMALRAKMTSEV